MKPARRGNTAATGTPAARGHVAIALAAAAIVLYEIAITRILSVALWYHFAFLAVSLAMLGIGAPGVWYALRGIGPRTLPRALMLAAVATPLSLAVLLAYGGPLPLRATVAAACILVPMLALGAAVCALLLDSRGESIGPRYAADLFGATAAAVAVVPLMHVLPTPAMVAGSAMLPAAALIVLNHRRAGWLLLIVVALVAAWREPFRVRHGKVYSEQSLPLQYERWTPTARLTVFTTPAHRRAFGWGFPAAYTPPPAEQVWLEQDGSAGTPITRGSAPGTLGHLFHDVTSLAHQIRPPRRVCVIGAGGGRDVLTALESGAAAVDAVEMNPYIVRLLSQEFRDYSGDVYHRPGVRAVVSEGRSYLTRTTERYDLIQISLIDSWAATAAGAYALSENFLYTVEAYRLYWNRLEPDGMISTSRWLADYEAARLAHLVRTALAREGVAEPGLHIAVAEAGEVATVLASRAPFTGALGESLSMVCARRGFTLRFPANAAGPSDVARVLHDGTAAFRARGIDLSPPVDDRPFFFHNLAVFGNAGADPGSFLGNAQAVLVLRRLMWIVVALAVALFFAPFLLRSALPRPPSFWRGSVYFAAIGVAFLLVEIPMIQRTILHLGHPSHAVTVVLAGMLLGAGAGSLCAARLRNRAPAWALALLITLAAANLGLDPMIRGSIGWPWAARAATAAMLAIVMGGFMGVALPLGMMRFDGPSRAWYWAVNGACGVVASVCSLGLAMTLGFSAVLWCGVALYALAAVMLLATPETTATG